jgi:hypothetical protein
VGLKSIFPGRRPLMCRSLLEIGNKGNFLRLEDNFPQVSMFCHRNLKHLRILNSNMVFQSSLKIIIAKAEGENKVYLIVS